MQGICLVSDWIKSMFTKHALVFDKAGKRSFKERAFNV